MFVVGSLSRALLLTLVVAITPWQADRVPREQARPNNLKQQTLAGAALPVNIAAEHARIAALPRPTIAPGRIVVKMADGATASEARAMAVHAGARSVVQPAYADFLVLTVPSDVDVVAAAAEIASQPGVVYATPDRVAFKTFVPNDPLYPSQWNFKRLDMEHAWDINRGGATSMVVAIIDTGLAYLDQGNYRQAPDLVGATYVSPHDFIWDDDTPVDLDGHGTHVTGTVGERTGNGMGCAGMAFNVSLMPIKAVSGPWDEAMGAPNVGTESVVAEAIRYAADHGAKVINMSFGFDGDVPPVQDAITYAIGKGAVVVAAAGNNGGSGNAPIWPAAYATSIPGLMAVAAVDYNFVRAPYSNSNDYVEIAAPGGNIDEDEDHDGYGDGILQQTLDFDLVDQGIFNQFAYFYVEGTSMATPHVSALSALLMQQGVSDPKAVEIVIERFATDVGPAGRDNDTGAGVINPRATLRGLGLNQ